MIPIGGFKGWDIGRVIYGLKCTANATTNSAHGVKLARNGEGLAVLEGNIPLLYGEVTDQDVDILDREKVFIDEICLH